MCVLCASCRLQRVTSLQTRAYDRKRAALRGCGRRPPWEEEPRATTNQPYNGRPISPPLAGNRSARPPRLSRTPHRLTVPAPLPPRFSEHPSCSAPQAAGSFVMARQNDRPAEPGADKNDPEKTFLQNEAKIRKFGENGQEADTPRRTVDRFRRRLRGLDDL